jgi:hypothetical protein
LERVSFGIVEEHSENMMNITGSEARGQADFRTVGLFCIVNGSLPSGIRKRKWADSSHREKNLVYN